MKRGSEKWRNRAVPVMMGAWNFGGLSFSATVFFERGPFFNRAASLSRTIAFDRQDVFSTSCPVLAGRCGIIHFRAHRVLIACSSRAHERAHGVLSWCALFVSVVRSSCVRRVLLVRLPMCGFRCAAVVRLPLCVLHGSSVARHPLRVIRCPSDRGAPVTLTTAALRSVVYL